MSLKAYKAAQVATEDPRVTEYRLFGQVTGALLNAKEVNAPVLAEILVFNRNESGFHQWRDLIVSKNDSMFLSKGADHSGIVIRIHLGDHGGPLLIKSCDLRQVTAVDKQHSGRCAHCHG